EQFRHVFPAVHSTPADLAFRGEPFAVSLRDRAGFAKSLGNAFRISNGISRPFRWAACGVDAHNSVRTNPDIPKLLCNGGGFPDLSQKVFPLFSRPNRGATAGRWPDGSNE